MIGRAGWFPVGAAAVAAAGVAVAAAGVAVAEAAVGTGGGR